jgi:hypothetical protein
MRHTQFFGSVVGTGLFIIGLAGSLAASTVPGFEVEVLVGGVPRPEYSARQATYIEAEHGREYSVRLTNRTNGRVAVALAVDGLNTIDARTSSVRRAAKWVLCPFETITIDGWQISSRTARRFYFTSEDRSYGAWLGKTANLGVIEAVVFRERAPRPVARRWRGGCDRREQEAAGRAAPRPPAAQGEASGALGQTRSGRSQKTSRLPDNLAATGIGRRTDNPVRWIEFEAEVSPIGHVRLRYEYRQQLVELGVLPEASRPSDLARREHSHGFIGMEFAPDPFARR